MNEKLRQARHSRRWSIDEAARRIGISRLTYIRWEKGTQVPHNSSLMLACAAFDLSPEQLGLEEIQPTAAQPLSPVLLTEQEIAQQRSGWSFLWHEDASIAAGEQRIVYDALECEIIAMALQWKQSAGSLIVLQELAHQAIRKHDAMHTEDYRNSYDTRITRRHALQAIAQFPIQMYGLALFSTGKRALPAPEEVLPACAAGLTACLELRQYELEGLFIIRSTLAAYLPALEYFARQSSPSQRDAAHLTSQSYLLVSMIAEHFGKYDQMEVASRRANLYGQIALDPNLEVAALIRLAVHFAYKDCDNKALEMYQEALALSSFVRTSPLMRGRVYAGLAGMSACCGQIQDALSFLGKAREIFPQRAEDDPSFRFAYCVQSHLPLWEGITYKHTGHYTDAVAAFLRYGSLTPISGQLELYRAEHLNYAASVAIMQRDLDAAYLYLDTAEDVAWTIRHEQRQAEARDTLRGMQLLWPHEPKAVQLREKMLARQN